MQITDTEVLPAIGEKLKNGSILVAIRQVEERTSGYKRWIVLAITSGSGSQYATWWLNKHPNEPYSTGIGHYFFDFQAAYNDWLTRQ